MRVGYSTSWTYLIILIYTDLLKFDNSYSWTKSKEVFYSVKVLRPETVQGDPATLLPVPSPPSDLGDSEPQACQTPRDQSASVDYNLSVGACKTDSSSEERFDCCDYHSSSQAQPKMHANVVLNSERSTVWLRHASGWIYWLWSQYRFEYYNT